MNTDIYKVQLEKEQKLVEDELSSIAKFDETTGEWEAAPEAQTMPEADENDLADRSEGFEERTSKAEVLKIRLQDIHDALEKIQEGSYGVCEVSGEPIEEDRLHANPAARTCKAHM
jgi:RNA polymerase-binding transcription factor DksA